MSSELYNQTQSEVDDLTDRQVEILSLVSKGCSNIDIAQLLEISPNTVKAHLATVLERLHVSNRTEASVLYEKHVNNDFYVASNVQELVPFIEIGLLYKSLSRTREIAENLSQLLYNFEVFTIQAQASKNLINDTASIKQAYLIKIDDLSEVNAALQISLFSNDVDSSQQALLYKSNHPLAEFNPASLVKHAVKIYRHILQDQIEKRRKQTAPSVSVFSLLSEALLLGEAISFDQLEHANKICDQLLKKSPNWHLPHAIKSVVINKLVTNGYSDDISEHMADQAMLARKALSQKPDSSWSQLAFAYFCALNSDLQLATKHLKASLAANRCQYRASQLLGQILAFQGDTKASIKIFKQMLSDFPSSESDGASYGALALVHYCADDFSSSKQMAKRALLYEDAPKVPMMLTLLSMAEQEQDEVALVAMLQQLRDLNVNEKAIKNSLLVAEKIVPADLMSRYTASLKRTGVI